MIQTEIVPEITSSHEDAGANRANQPFPSVDLQNTDMRLRIVPTKLVHLQRCEMTFRHIAVSSDVVIP